MSSNETTKLPKGGGSELNELLDRPERKPALKNWDWKTAKPMRCGAPVWPHKDDIDDVSNAMFRRPPDGEPEQQNEL